MRPSFAALLIPLLASCSSGDVVRDETGVVSAGDESVYLLQPGDCLQPDPGVTSPVSQLPVVPCSEPHTHEVFGTVTLAEDGPYPGPEAVQQLADRECINELEQEFRLTLDDGYFITYLLPTFAGWNDEADPDRTAVCVLAFPGTEFATGSVVAEARAAIGGS